jgi:hypothetical protein
VLALTKPFAGQSSLDPVHVSATSQPPAIAARQTKLAGSRASEGQSGLDPVQLSATSHTPRCARHSRAGEAKPSAGHDVLPPQVSSTSHAPRDARHTVEAGAAPEATQRGVPVHCIDPTSHGLPVAHGAPGTHDVEQPPSPSHDPPLHVVPVGAKASGGQSAPPVEQLSATSHVPLAARHTCAASWRASSGHVGLVPSHTSGGSQSPREARHTVPLG